MKKFIDILLYIWQFPQNLAGLIFRLFTPADILKVKDYRGDVNVYVSSRMSGGITLGKYITLSKSYADLERNKDIWDHEYGHTRQSRMLGPLYLFIIGIPSITWASLYGWIIPYTRNGYYKFFCEHWADRLGGVDRN